MTSACTLFIAILLWLGYIHRPFSVMTKSDPQLVDTVERLQSAVNNLQGLEGLCIKVLVFLSALQQLCACRQ